MNTSEWTMAIGGAAGLALAVFGIRMLITGHAPEVTARAFRTVKDAGAYHLLFGVALTAVVIGTGLRRPALTLVTTVLAVALVGLAVIRFRPRGRRSPGEKTGE
jgi:hypothetical protein